MSNAANVKQIDRTRSREERDLKLLVASFAQVLDTAHGRLVVNFIIENVARASGDPFSPDIAVHAHNAGRQAVSREVKQFIVDMVGPLYLKKLNDQRFEEMVDEQVSRELKNG